MAAGSNLSQQYSLRIGDTVQLIVGEPSGYVYSELFSSVYNRVTVFPVDHGIDSTKDPYFPNVAFATFKVIVPNKCVALNSYNYWLQTKQSSLVQSNELDIKLANAKKKMKEEQKANLLEQQKKHGCVVAYGDYVQLVHIGSKKYISISSEFTSKTESNNLLVQLSSENSESCVFKILPRYKVKSEGDLVRYGDQIKVESMQTLGQFLHCSQRPLSSANVSIQGNHYELNLSAVETAFAIVPHFSPTVESTGALRAGCCVRLFHREGECYVVAEGSFAEDKLVEKVHCRQRRVDQRGHGMPSTSANTFWQIEKESDTRSGEVLNWEERCRIRHLPTRLYLTVQRNEEDTQWVVGLREKGAADELDTLFSFHSLLKEGEVVQLESYARIKHLLSNTWLHLDTQPYARQSYDSRNAGLAGIQWDSAKLLQLSSCKAKGDYDAFTLQEVEEHLIDKFNYMAGILPILKNYNESVAAGTLTKKAGSQMVSVLKELQGWLDDSDAREAKNKQKLMRNLRVLEQLCDILKNRPIADPNLTVVHTSVCRECYNVISQYLKGDSRKNENYLARFIEFFQTQVGMDLNTEELLVEVVQDNIDIVSRMAKTQIGYMIEQLRDKKDPRFLYFLSSLCVCSGKPIPSTQLAILKQLVVPYGKDLFVKTVTRGKDVLCVFKGADPINIAYLHDPSKPKFQFLEAQLHLFARLCKGNNESAIEQLSYYKRTGTGFVSFEEAYACANNPHIHSTLKSRYVELILVMFVAVGNNRSYLDHLCYSFVFSRLSAKPYEDTGADNVTALTGEVSEYFPTLQTWILDVIKANKVLVCDEQHIAHNEVLAQILDLLCHLVNYGYYDDQGDIDDVLHPLFELLDGKTDSPGNGESDGFMLEGRKKDTEVNRAVFAVKKKGLDVAEMFFKFKSYVHLQVFLHDFSMFEEGEQDFLAEILHPFPPSVFQELQSTSTKNDLFKDEESCYLRSAVKARLDKILSGSIPVTVENAKEVLKDLSCYENNDLVRQSLRLLTEMHFQDSSLFSHAAHTQLLIAEESLAVSTEIQEQLPKLRHLLSIDCGAEGQWKISDILVKLTWYCTRPNDEEPHSENQMMLYNYGVLTDVLSYVLAKDFRQHMKEDQDMTPMVPQRRISQQGMVQDVLRNCFTLLHSLAYKNEPVQQRLFERLDDLLKVRVAVFALADVLTEIFLASAQMCMKVTEQNVNSIFKAIVATDDPYTQAQLIISLQALAKIEELDLPMDRHQTAIVNNFCKYRQKIGEKIIGEEPEKVEERWKLLTKSDNDNPNLQLLLSLTDLLATCAEGDNIFIESVCQTLLPAEELIRIMSSESIPVDRKRPFVRYLTWVYIDTDGERGVSEGTILAHHQMLWKYLKHVAENLHNLRRLLEAVHKDNRGPYRRALVATVRRRTYSMGYKIVKIKTPIKNLPFFTREDGELIPGVLEYFTEGIVPFLNSFFNILLDPKLLNEIPNGEEITVQIASALIRLVDNAMKFVTSDTLVRQFQSLVLTLCQMPLIEQKLKIDSETYNRLNASIRAQKHSVSRSTRRHGNIYQRQVKLNRDFHRFVKNYQRAYQGPDNARDQIGSPLNKSHYCDEGEELPLGPNFQMLIKLYTQSSAKGIPSVIPETERLLRQLEISVSSEEHLSESEQQEQDLLDIRCLQVLRALIHNQIKMIDPEEEDRNAANYRCLCRDLVNPVQVAIQGFDNAAKRVLPLLSHQKESISDETISLLKALLFSGNVTVQTGLEEVAKHTREERLFLFLKQKLLQSSTRYNENQSLQYELYQRKIDQKKLLASASLSFPAIGASAVDTNSGAVHKTSFDFTVTVEDDNASDDKEMFALESFSETKVSSSARGLSVDSAMVRYLPSPSRRSRSRSMQWGFNGSGMIDTETDSFLDMESSLIPRTSDANIMQSSEVQTDVFLLPQADTSTKLVLEVIGLMCDGQRKSMQDYLRCQPDNFKSVNVVAEVAEFLQTFTKNISPENYEQIKEVLQALIEVCVGNADNQQVVLDKQVVEPINRILQLGKLHAGQDVSDDEVDVLEIKVKAVELLEVMLEETSPQSAAIKKGLLGSISVHSLLTSMTYFRAMATKPLVKKNEKDDDAIRGKFQCYHVLITLGGSDKKLDNVCIDEMCDEEDSGGSQWRNQSRSVEIHYEYQKDKHLLTKVHFFHDTDNNLREDVVEKVKWNIDRESMENKQRALIDLLGPLKTDLHHQQKLRKFLVFRVIKAFPRLRHWLLILLTLLLNLFVLIFYDLPNNLAVISQLDNITNITNYTRPATSYQPAVRWLVHPYIVYLLGPVQFILALWMVLEYFLINFPHFRLPEFLQAIIPCKKFPKPTLIDVNIFGLNTIWVLVFLICSGLSLGFQGYFYCICMLHIVFNNDILQRVLRSVTKNGIALLWVAALGFAVLFIYAVLSFTFMWDRFYMTEDAVLYCDTLFQCFVTIIRYGLIDNLGLDIPLVMKSFDKDTRPPFYLAGWRLLFDITFFIIVTTIGLNIVFGIIVDSFTELRDERSNIEEDQKAKCFICDLESHEFDRKAKGFDTHIKEDHNMWAYVYYAYYLDSIDTNNHTAIQKYVFNLMSKKKPDFFPRQEACCFKASENPVELKLKQLQAEMMSLIQRFRYKDASKSANAKKEERKQWEMNVLKKQQSFYDGNEE